MEKKLRETYTFRPAKENIGMLEELERIGATENRKLNNMIETILLEFIKSCKKDKLKNF